MRKLTAFLEQLLNFGLKYPQDSLYLQYGHRRKYCLWKYKSMSMCNISQEITVNLNALG